MATLNDVSSLLKKAANYARSPRLSTHSLNP